MNCYTCQTSDIPRQTLDMPHYKQFNVPNVLLPLAVCESSVCNLNAHFSFFYAACFVLYAVLCAMIFAYCIIYCYKC